MPAGERSADNKLKCRLCNDLGWTRLDVGVGHPQFGRIIRCGCKAVEDSARLQNISSMTPEEREFRLEDIECTGKKDTPVMVEACREFLDRQYGMLTIHGRCGNAKSHALCGVVNALLERGHEAVYVLAFDLINYIREAYDSNDRAYGRLMRFTTVKFLAVDELDKIFPLSFWEQKQLVHFFNERYRYGSDEKRGTICALNGDPFAVLDGLDPILSRMGDGRNRIVYNGDEDMRPGLRNERCRHGREVCPECDHGTIWAT